jgi:S-adenosylmethionine hydrolase
MKFIHLIADYGTGDGAFGEVMQKLYGLDQDVTVMPTSVPAFSTIATGFWTAQYAMVNPIKDMVIYTNTAPRKDNKQSRDRNEGEKLVFAKLTNGVRIVGVNAGYCFSLIKPMIEAFHSVNVANKGSQFRSRDFYPEAVIGILNNQASFIGDPIDPSTIQDVPSQKIAWIDGYGNIKTTTRLSSVTLQAGQPVLVTLNGIKRTAYFTDGTFSVHEGELAFAPGSSGGDNRCMELFLRGLSAWKEFGKPDVEAEFTIEPLEA